MAHRVLFICLALIAVLGSATAADPATTAGAPTTSSSSSSSSAFAPVSDSTVGNTDDGSGDGQGDAAPVGGPVPAGEFPSTLDGPALAPGNSGATRAAGVFASVALAATIGRYFFF